MGIAIDFKSHLWSVVYDICISVSILGLLTMLSLNRFLNVKALVGTFYQEKALVGAFSVNVISSRRFIWSSNYHRGHHAQ